MSLRNILVNWPIFTEVPFCLRFFKKLFWHICNIKNRTVLSSKLTFISYFRYLSRVDKPATIIHQKSPSKSSLPNAATILNNRAIGEKDMTRYLPTFEKSSNMPQRNLHQIFTYMNSKNSYINSKNSKKSPKACGQIEITIPKNR